jgi:hypothetical protein
MRFGKALMAAWLLFACLGAGDKWQERAWWQSNWSGDAAEIFALLAESQEGAILIEKAKKKDPQILRTITVGDSSITESTFLRSYSLLDGKEKYNLQHAIQLNRYSTRANAVLDLAHELTHFNQRIPLNPYKDDLNAVEFIRHGIEGEGGELDAFEKECRVAWEMEKKYPAMPVSESCSPYKRREGQFDRSYASRDFYKVGTWISELTEVKEEMSELSEELVVFRSSHAKKPYPLALLGEYYQTVATACQNNERKAQLIREQSGRMPASIKAGHLQKELKKIERYLLERCSQKINNKTRRIAD